MFGLKNQNKILYTLRRYKKSKSIKLRIDGSGNILISAPSRLSKKYVDNFIIKNSKWINDKINDIESLSTPMIKTKKEDYLKYKEQARKLVKEKIEKINTHYNFEYKSISIRNQRTRWGSCSNKKNLNFNYKIALIPDKLAEYIVIHELCHLKEMNHAESFWKLVEQTMPEYKAVRKELHKIRI